MGSYVSIAGKMGCTAETLHKWIRQAERDRGTGRLTTGERERMKELERENRELRRPTRFCARPARFSLRRSSTAD